MPCGTGSAVPRASSERALVVLLVARCAQEGVLFAAAAAALHIALAGQAELPVAGIALALTGAGIVLASALREARATTQNVRVTAAFMLGAAAYGVVTLPPHPEGVAVLGRAVFFAIAGELFLWRELGIARALVRWSDARNAGFLAIAVAAVVAVLPGAIDRIGLTVALVGAVAATGVALSLSRSAEELLLAGDEARGAAGRGTAAGTAVVLAALAIVAGLAASFGREPIGRAADALLSIVVQLVYGVLLAFGYVAAWFVAFFQAFRRTGFKIPTLPFVSRMTPEEEQEALRQIEATRPWVVGAVEIIVAAIAIVVALVLVERMTRERRAVLPEGASLERGAAAGDDLRSMLAGLLPRRRRRPRPPRDDGTPGAALRLLYWRLLARAETAGIGWRELGETPAEHAHRARIADPRFTAARPLVQAFEELRYGGREPDPDTLGRARAALASVEERA